MKYYVIIGGKEFEIDLFEESGMLKGRLEGRTYGVDCAVIEENEKYSVVIEGESFNVSQDRRNSEIDLIVGGHLYQATVFDEREKGARALEQEQDLSGRQVLQSVMPGIVRRIMVTEGEEVKAGTPLLILEAMKMENELCAERGGRVVKIHTAEGKTVNSSDPLVTIE